MRHIGRATWKRIALATTVAVIAIAAARCFPSDRAWSISVRNDSATTYIVRIADLGNSYLYEVGPGRTGSLMAGTPPAPRVSILSPGNCEVVETLVMAPDVETVIVIGEESPGPLATAVATSYPGGLAPPQLPTTNGCRSEP